MPTHRAAVRITRGNVYKALSLACSDARASQLLGSYCYLVCRWPSQPGQPPAVMCSWPPACNQKQALEKASHKLPVETVPPDPRSKYLQTRLTTAPLRQQGFLKWHVGSRMHRHKSQLASSTLSTSTPHLPSLPLAFLIPFTWLEWLLQSSHVHSFLTLFKKINSQSIRRSPMGQKNGCI